MDGLTTKPRQISTHQKGGTTRFRVKCRHMAQMTTCLIEQLFTSLHISIVDITTSRNGKTLHIEIHVLHILCRHVEHVIGEPHHRAFLHLTLSFTDLFRITAVGHTHITGETQFDCQVGMLCFVARQAKLYFTSLIDIVASSTDAPLGIVTLSRQCLNLIRIKCHHLTHTDMAQRHAYSTEEIIRTDRVSIPFGNRPPWYAERIFLTIGEGEGHGIDLHFQLSLGLDTIDSLIVNHSTVIGEECSVLTGDIDK